MYVCMYVYIDRSPNLQEPGVFTNCCDELHSRDPSSGELRTAVGFRALGLFKFRVWGFGFRVLGCFNQGGFKALGFGALGF